MTNQTRIVTRYEIRQFGRKGSCYSQMMFGGRVVERSRAQRIVKFLKRRGLDVKIAPIKIAA